MNQSELSVLLDNLIAGWENEVVEFKNVGDNYPTSDLGKYFSALSNEANLRGQGSAWLIFGIDNKQRAVVGSNYREERERLQSLKQQIAQDTEPSVTFRDIHELAHKDGRVVLFEIPMAPVGVPISWKGFCYARAGESLTSLGLDKLDAIRQQTQNTDWTAQVVEDARLDHLDPVALQRSRDAFAAKYANRFEKKDVAGWTDEVFLDRAKLTADGKITRTALLLLGKPESVHLLSPHPAQLTWKLEGPEQAYEHFGPPFLLETSRLYRNIRNIQMRILPQDELYPVELAKYDQKIVLEALHNCIAHQDYARFERIIVTEHTDRIIFENGGNFYEGQPGDYLNNSKTPRRYRNPFLVRAMTEMNMIDTLGYGIYKMFSGQAQRYFPMPDYDLSEEAAVKLTLHGRIIDPAYSRLLIQKTDLALSDVLALDRVQKKLPLDEQSVRRLRRAKLIEGHKPNLHVSASVADATATRAQYIRTRGQDDEFYMKLICDFISKFGGASRKDIQDLLLDKLSDALTPSQKRSKISNLITQMRRSNTIQNTSSRRAPRWELVEKVQNKKL